VPSKFDSRIEKIRAVPANTGSVRRLVAAWPPVPPKFDSRQATRATDAPDGPASVDSEASCPGKPPGILGMPGPDMKAHTPADTPRTAIPDTPRSSISILDIPESDSEGEGDDERAPSRERDGCLSSDECDERLKGL
jgi:hypothetical protein